MGDEFTAGGFTELRPLTLTQVEDLCDHRRRRRPFPAKREKEIAAGTTSIRESAEWGGEGIDRMKFSSHLLRRCVCVNLSCP